MRNGVAEYYPIAHSIHIWEVVTSGLALSYIKDITMPEPGNSRNTRTGRFYVRVPKENISEINGYVKESGMYQAHFMSNALVVGARQMAPTHQKSSAQQIIADARQRLMRKALEQLAPEHRTILELAYFEGLSQAEMAARLGQPQGTVNAHTRMALHNLTSLLSSYRLLTD
jgi:RNA polymerase sigma factor (sigma-70 family)